MNLFNQTHKHAMTQIKSSEYAVKFCSSTRTMDTEII